MHKITCVTALLCAVTLVLCIVMTLHSINGASLVGCGAGSSCDDVLGGRWSKLFGFFPVSGLAV
ncbi:MAG: vitamin K epoxide reductase family protein, partial [Bacteroidia bacterium]|nr:vitamin K epoxide reductase family protein [Bacteroidia bacterium]